MIGEIICNLAEFFKVRYEIILLLLGIIWFAAGWIICSIVLNRRWIKSLDILDIKSKNKVIKHAHTKRKREYITKKAKEI